ncbi:RNA polymerase sigma-70 factor [Flavobacterium sp. NG2]|uniref:RNA polymerase sigma-70 factor n=1 Tax=Flavobacterium sp. NG2 TaxID=3097547 RepID=UPI002A8182D7|nr:RNA polymerase sigma-70 factor [Flavobacterium sp. NG2]WPR71389.1 RNA polymerase sigma-70 factor [Flavobacterium sp. NG2]
MNSVTGNSLSLKEYKVLFDTYYTSLCLFANKYLGDLDLSKDVVQEVFVKLWHHQIVLENENAIKSYLYTCVKNKSLDYLKSKSFNSCQQLTDKELQLCESEQFFEKELLLEEVERMVDIAVNTLPFKCKEIIRLSLKGFKNNQISEELSISINTVKTQKKIAYQKLRPVLKVMFGFLMVFFLCK